MQELEQKSNIQCHSGLRPGIYYNEFPIAVGNDRKKNMRKFKDLRFNEKLLIVMAIILIAGIILKWPQVKEGFVKGWERFGLTKSEKIEQ